MKGPVTGLTGLSGRSPCARRAPICITEGEVTTEVFLTKRWEFPRSDELVAFFAKLFLGLFASAVLAGSGYVLGWLVSLSFWAPTDKTVTASAICSTAVGAGTGAYAIWFASGVRLWRHLAGGALVVLAAVGGGLGGLWYGGNVHRTGGLPGIPELSGIMVGAVIAANVMALGMRALSWLRSVRSRPTATPSAR